MKAAERVEDLKPKGIKILELPVDTVAQLIERLRDNLKTWVRILACVRFFIYSVPFLLLCCPCKALEGPILTGVCKIL